MPNTFTLLNDLLVTTKEHLLSLDSMMGLSSRRDVTDTSGSGTVTNNGLQHVLSTGTTTTSDALLDTADTGFYLGSVGLNAIVNVRLSATPTGQQSALWGFLNNDSGVGFGVDATSPFVFTRTNGTDTKVVQSSWNADKLDGTGGSGFTLDIAKGVFYQVSVVSNVVEFAVILPTTAGVLTTVVAHRVASNTPPIIDTPALPIRVQCLNGTTNSNLSVYVASRDITVFRNTSGVFRTVASQVGVAITPTFATFMNLRHKTDDGLVNVPAKLLKVESSNGGPVLIRLVRNSNPTNASWGSAESFVEEETCIEVDTTDTSPESATDVVYQWIAPAGYHCHVFPSCVDFVIDRNYSLQVKSFGASFGSAINVVWSENW